MVAEAIATLEAAQQDTPVFTSRPIAPKRPDVYEWVTVSIADEYDKAGFRAVSNALARMAEGEMFRGVLYGEKKERTFAMGHIIKMRDGSLATEAVFSCNGVETRQRMDVFESVSFRRKVRKPKNGELPESPSVDVQPAESVENRAAALGIVLA